jgi:hypothetical protein
MAPVWSGGGHTMRQKYLLAFDERRDTGVREHFFHFMWGYLLPATHAIIEIQADRESAGPSQEFIFVSCGPVMDARTIEMARLLGVDCSIVQDEREVLQPGTLHVAVQRWDLFLADYATYLQLPWPEAVLRLMRQAAQQRSIPPVVSSRSRIAQEIRHLRQVVLGRVPAGDDDDAGCYYLLKRSEEPSYYAREGGRAHTPTYGTTRRSLLGIDRAAVALGRGPQGVAVYEPGRHTLAEQIRAFSRCRGIIAIRGAELANIVWLESGSKVIVINAGTFQLWAPPALGLANLLEIGYAEIEWGEDPYPTLTDDLIERIRAHLES